MASSSRNRIADTGFPSIDQNRGKKKKKRGGPDRCPTISNVTRNGQVTSSPLPLTCPPTRGTYIHESVTLSLTKLAFTYASSIVRWVWKCLGHSGTMLSAVARSSPGRLEYDGHREARLPLYRPSPTAPLFSMADGQSYRPSTNSLTLRGIPPGQGGRPSAWKSSSWGIRRESILFPFLRPIIFVLYPLSRMSTSRVIFPAYLVWKRIRTTSLKKYWKLFSVRLSIPFGWWNFQRERNFGGKFALEVSKKIVELFSGRIESKKK